MRDHMKKGDMVLFYHSSSKPTGVYGITKVTANAHADETQFEKGGEYYDPKSTKENARWQCVDVGFVKKFKEPVTLEQIKFQDSLAGMMVRNRGSRLSIQPVSEKHFKIIEELGK
jgi:predicted RNA-binding protein with PUA-like domain